MSALKNTILRQVIDAPDCEGEDLQHDFVLNIP